MAYLEQVSGVRLPSVRSIVGTLHPSMSLVLILDQQFHDGIADLGFVSAVPQLDLFKPSSVSAPGFDLNTHCYSFNQHGQERLLGATQSATASPLLCFSAHSRPRAGVEVARLGGSQSPASWLAPSPVGLYFPHQNLSLSSLDRPCLLASPYVKDWRTPKGKPGVRRGNSKSRH